LFAHHVRYIRIRRVRMKKSIYLDWNIFQDVIQERRGTGMKEHLEAAIRKGYLVPYSCAHMRDLSRCGNQSYIDNDISEISKITRNWCVGMKFKEDSLDYDKVPPEHVLAEIRKQQNEEKKPELKSIFYFTPYEVNMSKISKENILVPYLNKNNKTMSPEIIESLIYDLYEKIFINHKIQKLFRNCLSELFKLNSPAFEVVLDMPLYQHLLSPKEVVAKNLNEIMNSFLAISGKSLESIPSGEKITTTYNVLDFFPAFSERLEKKNNIRNISTDAEHVFLASDSRYLVCGDKKMIEKTTIIYNAFGIKTRVFDPESFLQNIEFL